MKNLLKWLKLALQFKREYYHDGYGIFSAVGGGTIVTINGRPEFDEYGINRGTTVTVSCFPFNGATPLYRTGIGIPVVTKIAFYQGSTGMWEDRDPLKIKLCTKGLIWRFFHVPKVLYFKVTKR